MNIQIIQIDWRFHLDFLFKIVYSYNGINGWHKTNYIKYAKVVPI